MLLGWFDNFASAFARQDMVTNDFLDYCQEQGAEWRRSIRRAIFDVLIVACTFILLALIGRI
jgi:hypothetical protein